MLLNILQCQIDIGILSSNQIQKLDHKTLKQRLILVSKYPLEIIVEPNHKPIGSTRRKNHTISFFLALVKATFIRLQLFNKTPVQFIVHRVRIHTRFESLERTNEMIIQSLSLPYPNKKHNIIHTWNLSTVETSNRQSS